MPTDPRRVQAVLARLSRNRIEHDIRHLSTAYLTRHTLGTYLDAAAGWLQGRCREIGLSNPRFHSYRKDGKDLKNVVADKPGKTATTILVSAHYDSRMQNLRDAQSPAPGANDNATGVAVALEIARVLMPLSLKDSLRFVFFSGEEQGLWGSKAYIPTVRREQLKLKFVLNLDQIGYPPPDRAIFVDRDEGGKQENNAASAELVARIQGLALDIVKVPTRVDPAYGSDYMPFEEAGYTIVGLYEAGKDYPQYHTSDDTIERVDLAYVHDMARLATATLLSEGELL